MPKWMLLKVGGGGTNGGVAFKVSLLTNPKAGNLKKKRRP